MEAQNDISEIFYSDLIFDLNKGTYNALRPYSYFFKQKEFELGLDDFVCREYRIEGVCLNRSQAFFNNKKTEFQKKCSDIIFNKSINKVFNYFVVIEQGGKLKSRIRSFKGFQIKMISDHEIYEREISLNDDISVFISVVKLEKFNDYMFDLFLDDSNCFIIQSQVALQMNEVLIKVFESCEFDLNTLNLNYLGILNHLCRSGSYVYKVGGDYGEEYWSLQLFHIKSKDVNHNNG